MPVTVSRIDYWRLKLAAIVNLVVGRTAAAEAVFDAMHRCWPNDPYVLSSRSHVRQQRGARDLAIDDACALVTAHPKRSAGDWFNLAFLLEEGSRFDDAEGAFRRALALDPKLDRAWYGLGLTLIRLKRFDEAVTALERNTQLQPMSPYGWYQLARVHVARSEPDKARRIISRLKGFEPGVAAQLERETGLVG